MYFVVMTLPNNEVSVADFATEEEAWNFVEKYEDVDTTDFVVTKRI